MYLKLRQFALTIPSLATCVDSEVLWRHLAAVRRHKKGSSESSVFTGDALRPEDWGHSGGL